MKSKIIILVLIGFLGIYMTPTLFANSQKEVHRAYPKQKAGIANSGFEEKLVNWSYTGVVRAIRLLPEYPTIYEEVKVYPTEGDYFAYVTDFSGPADSPPNEPGVLSQTFTVPMGVTTLSFDWRFFQDSPLNTSADNDFFRAILITPSGEKEIAYADSFSDFMKESERGYLIGGWYRYSDYRTTEVNVANLMGRTVTLEFRVENNGDYRLDAAAVIDNISLGTNRSNNEIHHVGI